MCTGYLRKHSEYCQRLSIGHLKTFPQNCKNIILLRFCNSRSTQQPRAMNTNIYWICILLKNVYILAHIIIIFPKGKAAHRYHKAGTFTLLTWAENVYIPWWGSLYHSKSLNVKNWHNETISTSTPILLPAVWISMSYFSYIQLLHQRTLLVELASPGAARCVHFLSSTGPGKETWTLFGKASVPSMLSLFWYVYCHSVFPCLKHLSYKTLNHQVQRRRLDS